MAKSIFKSKVFLPIQLESHLCSYVSPHHKSQQSNKNIHKYKWPTERAHEIGSKTIKRKNNSDVAINARQDCHPGNIHQMSQKYCQQNANNHQTLHSLREIPNIITKRMNTYEAQGDATEAGRQKYELIKRRLRHALENRGYYNSESKRKRSLKETIPAQQQSQRNKILSYQSYISKEAISAILKPIPQKGSKQQNRYQHISYKKQIRQKKQQKASIAHQRQSYSRRSSVKGWTRYPPFENKVLSNLSIEEFNK